MTKCTTKTISFTRCKRRKVQADFTGGDITSDAGAMLLDEVDNVISTEAISTFGIDFSARLHFLG